MAVKYRYADQCMVQGITAETAYDTLASYSAGDYFSLRNFSLAIAYDDTRVPSPGGDGTEMGLNSYVSRHDIRMTLTLDMASFTDLAWLSAYALGDMDVTPNTSDYLHDHKLAADSVSQLPSFTLYATEAGEQNYYTGCVIDTLTVSTDNNGYIQAVAEIIASGRRNTASEGYASSQSDPPVISNMTSIWMETGAAIDIQTAPATDGTTMLTSTTASITLTSRVLGGWSFTVNNNHRAEQGYQQPNSDDNLARGELLRGAKREVTATLSGVTFESDEFEDYFLGATATAIQPHMALEIHSYCDDYGTVATSWFYTFIAVFPAMTLDPIGASSDDDGIVTRDLKLTALSPAAGHGTGITYQDAIQFYVVDAIAAYAG